MSYTLKMEKRKKKREALPIVALGKEPLPRVSLGYAPYLPHNVVT
jgi:hypothetical protein